MNKTQLSDNKGIYIYINICTYHTVCDETQNLNATDSETFFPVPKFSETGSGTFSIPNFFETDSRTFSILKKF